MAAEVLDAAHNLILYEGFPNIDVVRLAPHFEKQLIEYFYAYDKYSTLYSQAEEITNEVESKLEEFNRGEPSNHSARYHRRIWMNNSMDEAARISEVMLPFHEKMESLEPLIRRRINMIGRYGVNILGKRLLFCTTVEAIYAVQVYRLLMPTNSAEIRVVLDMSNFDYLDLAPIAQGFEFEVVYKFMKPL